MNSEKSNVVRPNEDKYAGSKQFVGKSVEEALNQAAAEFGVRPAALKFEVVKDTTFSILGFVRKGEAVIRVWPPSAPAVGAEEETEVAEELEPEAEESEAARGDAEAALDREEDEPSGAMLKGNPPELEDVATEVLATLIDKMGLIAAVEVADPGGELDPYTNETTPMVLNAVGDDLGMLIGRRGETLRDMQFITRLIISRQLGVWPNVIVDVEGYKAKRSTSLQTLARRMADEVRQTHRPAVLEPMPAYERRIVHLTLRDDPDVYTESTGEDEHRKVQILPRK
jgi:spoIIIJ-associated protein